MNALIAWSYLIRSRNVGGARYLSSRIAKRFGCHAHGFGWACSSEAMPTQSRGHGTQRRHEDWVKCGPKFWCCKNMEPPLHWVFLPQNSRARRLAWLATRNVAPRSARRADSVGHRIVMA